MQHHPGNELTLHFIPSPLGMDWSSPVKLTYSALKNITSLRPRFMGHVFVELKSRKNFELTGMTSKTFDYLQQLLIHKKGLDIFYHSFEGTLEDEFLVKQELGFYLKTGYSNFIKFILNDQQFERAMQYLTEYRKDKLDSQYGLANRPRYREGAGCSAFGASFVDLLELFEQDMKESWSQTISIPKRFIDVPLHRVLLGAHAWAQENEEHKRLTFWDPDRMFHWVRKKVSNPEPKNFQLLEIEKARGILMDKRDHRAPTGKIWL